MDEIHHEIEDIWKYLAFILHKLFQLAHMKKGASLKDVLTQIERDTMRLIEHIKEKCNFDVERILYRKEWGL